MVGTTDMQKKVKAKVRDIAPCGQKENTMRDLYSYRVELFLFTCIPIQIRINGKNARKSTNDSKYKWKDWGADISVPWLMASAESEERVGERERGRLKVYFQIVDTVVSHEVCSKFYTKEAGPWSETCIRVQFKYLMIGPLFCHKTPSKRTAWVKLDLVSCP